SAEIELGETTNWYYSQAPNTTTTVTDPGFSVGSAATVSVSVSRDSGLMSGNPTGAFEVQLGSDTCSGTLSSGSGTCMLTPSASGAQTLTAEYLGFEGFDASSDSLEVAVGAATATVAITSDSPDPSAVGQAYAVAVTVTGSGATPTGSVTVDDGDENCNITLAGGSGSCNLTSVTAGGKTLTADYGGDATYGSAQDTESQTVSQATPTVTITSDAPDPSVVGEAYTVAVSVSGGGATPTGSVAVDDGDEGCNITLSGGSGSCALTSTTAGAKTLTAAYGGDANYVSAQDTEAHTVTAGTPTVTITDDSPDPSAVGQAYAVDVTVSGAGATPTGTVTVDDGDDNCNITLAGGTGSCNLTSLTGGAKTLTAAYGGDANYSAAQDTEAHSVSLTAATVSITGDSPDPSVVGQAYTVDVSVSGSGATPTGTVTVDDGAENCNITLSGGSGSCSLTSTTAGAKTLTASYSGDANYAAGQDTESHQVDQATPTVSIDSDSPDPSAVGEAYTVAVTVSGAGAAPTGSVTVDDGSDNCSITLSGGTGSCDLTSTTVGPKTLTAAYGGDANYTSAQDTEAHTVNQGLPTVTINSDSPDPSLVGQAYTVAVTVAAGGATPTGSVTVDDGDANCSITLASGSGSCGLTSTTAGAKTLTASYGGDGNYTTAQDTEAHTVNQATPIVSITSDSPDPSSIGQTYTVAVTVNGDGANPTGSVTVDDGDDNCSITLSAGTGSCDLTSTTAGAKTLTAAYGGDVNYTSAQDTEAHSVSQATPTVTITSDSPDPSLVGQTYSVAVTVSGDGVDPTGSVMVDDGADNCSITLAAGAGSCDLASATAGGKTLTASYAGDANYLAAQDTEAHTVSQATPAVTITSDAPDPSPVGQAYEVVVTVTGDGATPTGSVTIDDGAENCQLTLSGGTGSCNLTSTTVGARTLTAAYDGDANYSPAQDTEPHTVTLAVPTVLITGDSPDPSEVGEAYTVSVTVSGAAGTPTGSVTVDDGAANCVVTLAGGSGACDLTSATAGAQVLTASYDGDGSYAPAQTTEAHTVSRATPTVIITDDSPDPSPVNLAYSVTVTVTSPAGTPTGTVTISDGTDQCETEALAGGSASCVLVSTTTGEKTLTATYAGDGNFESAQGTEPHTVSEPVADEIFSDSFEDL
ncbi:MAG: Ig-like domain repeat protein, partial [Pseudomonadota bacterium]